MENRYIIGYELYTGKVTDIKIKQGNVDTSILEMQIYENGAPADLTGETIEFRFLKPDNTLVYQDSTSGVTILDAPKGIVQCVLKSNTLACPGMVLCEVFRSKDGKELTTPTFGFTVEKSIGEGVESTNYIKIIDVKIKEVNDLIAYVKTLEAVKGDDGNSAYQVWLNAGNTGTVQDYLNSLKGQQGLKGEKPAHQWIGTSLQVENPDGTWGTPVNLKGADGVLTGSVNWSQIQDIPTNLESTEGSQSKVNTAITTLKGEVPTDGDTLAKLRNLISGLQTLLNSDDVNLDTIQEIISYIKNNKTILDGVTINKINYTDIINDLLHSDTNKPLSANQGKELKGQIDNHKNNTLTAHEKLTVISSATGTVNLDLSLANGFDVTLTGATTFNFANPPATGNVFAFTLYINQGATAQTVTFPASVKWSNDSIPDISTVSKTNILVFVTKDGGARWHGALVGNKFAI